MLSILWMTLGYADGQVPNRIKQPKMEYTKIFFKGGLKYEDVKVLEIQPDGLRISHSGGIAKVSYRKMTRLQIRQFGIDLEKAAEHEAKSKEKQSEALKQMERDRQEVAERKKRKADEKEEAEAFAEVESGGGESSEAKVAFKGTINITYYGKFYSRNAMHRAIRNGAWKSWPLWKLNTGKIVVITNAGAADSYYNPGRRGRASSTKLWIKAALTSDRSTRRIENAAGKPKSFPVYRIIPTP